MAVGSLLVQALYTGTGVYEVGVVKVTKLHLVVLSQSNAHHLRRLVSIIGDRSHIVAFSELQGSRAPDRPFQVA